MAEGFNIGDLIRLTRTLHQVEGQYMERPTKTLGTVPEGTTGQVVGIELQVVGMELVNNVLSVTLDLDATLRDVVWLVPTDAVEMIPANG